MKKKIVCLLLAACMLFALAACGSGKDAPAEPESTPLPDESTDNVAVFEDDPGWQNPVMNFIGNYECGRAHALVECSGRNEARITIDWGSSAWETTRWTILGPLDTDTLTITYSGCVKQNFVYGDNGELKSQEDVYNDGTGTVVFREDGAFVWHEDKSEYEEDLLFEWMPVVVN